MRVLHPVELMALRFTIGGLLVAVVYARRLKSVRGIWIWDGARTGLFLCAGYLFQVIGLVTITASRSAFLTATYVPLTPFAAFFLQRTRPDLGGILGITLVSLGLFAFSAHSGLAGRGFSLGSGDLWTLGCAAAFAVQLIYTNIAARRSDFAVVTMLQLWLTAATAWGLVAARGGFSVPWTRVPWVEVLYLATLATAFVLTLQTWALGRTPPVRAAIIFSTEPIFAALFAGLFFGERMGRAEILGAALILVGVFATELWAPARAWLRGRSARTEAPR